METNPHIAEDLTPQRHYRFFQLERRNAESQQPANFRMFIKNINLYPGARENIRATQSRRAGADNSHALPTRRDLACGWPPAHRQRGIGDIAFKIANRHRAAFVFQRTGPFA